jgi:hypothetical protein
MFQISQRLSRCFGITYIVDQEHLGGREFRLLVAGILLVATSSYVKVHEVLLGFSSSLP